MVSKPPDLLCFRQGRRFPTSVFALGLRLGDPLTLPLRHHLALELGDCANDVQHHSAGRIASIHTHAQYPERKNTVAREHLAAGMRMAGIPEQETHLSCRVVRLSYEATNVERRLAIITPIDVVGYGRVKTTEEAGMLPSLNRRLDDCPMSAPRILLWVSFRAKSATLTINRLRVSS
jgi:hypothetical protein